MSILAQIDYFWHIISNGECCQGQNIDFALNLLTYPGMPLDAYIIGISDITLRPVHAQQSTPVSSPKQNACKQRLLVRMGCILQMLQGAVPRVAAAQCHLFQHLTVSPICHARRMMASNDKQWTGIKATRNTDHQMMSVGSVGKISNLGDPDRKLELGRLICSRFIGSTGQRLPLRCGSTAVLDDGMNPETGH
ncbi:hypothetical protein M431DRAFT_207456 [Trichoderma harzianum CBS 226.95]|uniref:Uncharacterized protein n=1 Tax=Trichoderma harzianum CBS 226.95 TaxID=983964 RepID=A0A2T4AWA7_TRIHA|nr:hypothetical protein M431DRAFT_207456 [Trichoderma harzianum CBS 226.95]PTB61268.1 hypothetical protein M431DRAFT_207456 [Trichoderma harzianum CBS 226.95]